MDIPSLISQRLESLNDPQLNLLWKSVMDKFYIDQFPQNGSKKEVHELYMKLLFQVLLKCDTDVKIDIKPDAQRSLGAQATNYNHLFHPSPELQKRPEGALRVGCADFQNKGINQYILEK